MIAVEMFHKFQYVARTNASLDSAMLFRVELKCSCRQANLRMGEKGQPGASGTLVSLRKTIAAVRCFSRRDC